MEINGNKNIGDENKNKNKNDFYKIQKEQNNFIIYYTKNKEIIIKYLNISKLDKLYKFIIHENLLTAELNCSNGREVLKKIKDVLELQNFELKEKEKQIELRIKLNYINFKFVMNEIEEFSHFLEVIKANKNKEIDELINKNKQIENNNNNLSDENDELKNKFNESEKKYNLLQSDNNKLKDKFKELEKQNNLLELDKEELNKKIDKLNKNNDIKMQFDKYDNSFNEEIFKFKQNTKNYISFNDFNELFWTSFLNTGVKTLDLSFTQRGNDLLNKLNNINFDNLEEIKLYNNKITDINPLEKMDLEKLQILHLNYNFIKDISPLEKMNLIQLKQLFLQNNQISDINPLKNVKCIYLEILFLDNNNIIDISPLSEVKFIGLKKLTLHKNQIQIIDVFEKVPFKYLEKLTLFFNNIDDISVFNKVNFPKMQTLWLYKNKFEYNDKKDIIKNLKNNIEDFN